MTDAELDQRLESFSERQRAIVRSYAPRISDPAQYRAFKLCTAANIDHVDQGTPDELVMRAAHFCFMGSGLPRVMNG